MNEMTEGREHSRLKTLDLIDIVSCAIISV